MIIDIQKEKISWQIFTIFIIQATSTTAFAVFFSGLSLFLTQQMHISKEAASTITSLFLSLNYFLPLAGGIIANKIISYKRLYSVSTFLSLIGCLVLAYSKFLYLGLALYLASSIANVCLNMFITQLYSSDQKSQRRVAFVWNYAGMNLGFMFGYFITGLSTISNNYFMLFNTMSLLVLFALLFGMIFVKEPIISHTICKPGSTQYRNCFIIFVSITATLLVLFNYPEPSHSLITVASIFSLLLICGYGFKEYQVMNRKNLAIFAGYSLAAIVFWTFYMLTPIAMMQFIENGVERDINGFSIAPQWFVNIDSFMILFCAPLLSYLIKKDHKKLTNINFFMISFLLVSSALGLLLFGLYLHTGDQKIPAWIMLAYLVLLTGGEMLISPLGGALIGDLIPERFRGVMTAAWSVNIGIGGLLSGIIANKFILPYVSIDGITLSNSIKLQHSLCLLFVSSLLITLALLITNKKIQIFNKLLNAYEVS